MSDSFSGAFRITADFALFTNPNTKSDPVSYPVPTLSALTGIAKALYWKPQFRYVINRVGIENPVKYYQFSFNGYKMKAKKSQKQFTGVMSNRSQIHRSVLRDVSYIVPVEIVLNHDKISEDRRKDCTLHKYYGIFKEAVLRGHGRHWGLPSMGVGEFLADVEWVSPKEVSAFKGETQELGHMFYDWDYENGKTPKHFHAVMEDGWVHYPQTEEVCV